MSWLTNCDFGCIKISSPLNGADIHACVQPVAIPDTIIPFNHTALFLLIALHCGCNPGSSTPAQEGLFRGSLRICWVKKVACIIINCSQWNPYGWIKNPPNLMCMHIHMCNVAVQFSQCCFFCSTVAPSKPICAVQGKAEFYQNISLTCRSEEGTPLPTYKWQSYDVSNNLRPNPAKSTDCMCLLLNPCYCISVMNSYPMSQWTL